MNVCPLNPVDPIKAICVWQTLCVHMARLRCAITTNPHVAALNHHVCQRSLIVKSFLSIIIIIPSSTNTKSELTLWLICGEQSW